MFTKMTAMVIIAFGVVALSAISATASPEFQAEAKWNAEGTNQVFKLSEITGECGRVKVEGVSPKTNISSKALLKPKYTECVALGISVTVNTGECEYELQNIKGTSEFAAESKLVNCKSGINVVIPAASCTIVIPEQEGVKAGTGRDLKTKSTYESEATANLEGFKYTPEGAGCALAGIKGGKNGSYVGKAIAKGLIVVGHPQPEIAVDPSKVSFETVTKGKDTVVYFNVGVISWTVPAVEYTVITGSTKAVTNKNGCAGTKLAPNAFCSVVLTYEVAAPENYLAELKLGSEVPVVIVKAEA